jgi:hypothetical protein
MEKCEPFDADKQLVPRGPDEPEPIWASLKEVDEIKTQAQKKRKSAPSRYVSSVCVCVCVCGCVYSTFDSFLISLSTLTPAAAAVAMQPRPPRTGARRGRSASARSKS